MNRVWLGLALLGGLVACRTETPAPPTDLTPPEWSYSGDTGPAHWGDLSPAWKLAKSGKQQSPIDIASAAAVRKDQAPLTVSYQETNLEILNNGHTVEDDYHNGGTLTVGGRAYKLAQFHFHSPSEHTIDGKHAPMELHLVHKDSGGKLAVISVLIEEGDTHAELAKLWRHIPQTPGRAQAVEGVKVNASRLLPISLASYRYSGSLTTPPCSEQVAWYVLQHSIEASAEQIAAFRKVIFGNNRPTQPLNGRTVNASR